MWQVLFAKVLKSLFVVQPLMIEGSDKMPKLPDIKVKVKYEDLDIAIEKANRLVELLREAKQIIDSLGRESEA